jgi:uncharacterized protein YlxW (UPF0749 family)
MDAGELFLSIPVVAIVMGVGSEMFSKWTKHQQEMARIRSASGLQMDQSARSAFDELRNEIAQLRDTTTKYDMSVERALEELRHRIAKLESREKATYRAPTQEGEQEAVVSAKNG